MIKGNFAVFILAHENPDRVVTWTCLEKYGYTGKKYIVLDDQDKCISQFQDKYGKDNILLFSKDYAQTLFDIMDRGKNRGCAVFARAAIPKLARDVGCKYFLVLDDDYVEFQYRFPEDGKLKLVYPTNLDKAFEYAVDFLDENKNVTCIAFAQGGDFIGGVQGSNFNKKVLRKVMNSFICDVDRPFQFNGRTNEDVNAYCLEGSRGKVFLTFVDLMVNQADTQQTNDGMTQIYLEQSTYTKSFYTVMCCPSFAKIRMMGDKHWRIHHSIDWEHAVPKIISGRYKKNI